MAVVVLTGCEPATYRPPQPPAASHGPLSYQSLDGPPGRVAGRVEWVGELPAVPPFHAARGVGGTTTTHLVPNPFTPVVDPNSRGLAGAVVFLRGVDPARAKSWDHPPVTVDVGEDELRMNGGRVGFVPVGGEAHFLSNRPTAQLVRGRGDDFFGLALPDPGVPRSRRFDRRGRVELSSGAGQYWMRADLFVCEHPYYAVTDTKGHFAFADVPAGRYELVAWHRNWATVRQERDPDSGLVARLYYADPGEVVRPVTVDPGGSVDISFPFDVGAFHPTKK